MVGMEAWDSSEIENKFIWMNEVAVRFEGWLIGLGWFEEIEGIGVNVRKRQATPNTTQK